MIMVTKVQLMPTTRDITNPAIAMLWSELIRSIVDPDMPGSSPPTQTKQNNYAVFEPTCTRIHVRVHNIIIS